MKKFISMMMTVCMTIAMCSMVFASGDGSAASLLGDPNSTLATPIKGILGVVQLVANAFAAGMLLYVGIKYVMSSANEKADLKKGSINYVIGAVIIFGASALLGIFSSLSGDIAAS